MTIPAVRILQAALLIPVVAVTAGCATSNQYVSKLFAPRPVIVKDSAQLVRFLEIDSLDANKEEWVKTDMGKKDSMALPVVPTEDPVAKTNIPGTRMPATQDGQGTRTKRSRE